MNKRKNLSNAIVAAFKAQGDGPDAMTQEKIAEIVGASQSVVQRLVTGKSLKSPHIFDVAAALGVDPTSYMEVASPRLKNSGDDGVAAGIFPQMIRDDESNWSNGGRLMLRLAGLLIAGVQDSPLVGIADKKAQAQARSLIKSLEGLQALRARPRKEGPDTPSETP